MIDLSTDNLPEELLGELKIKPDEKAENIVAIIDEINGEADIDAVIIAYYRKHAEILKRPVAQAKLKKLAEDKRIYQLPHRKATYVPIDPAEDNATKDG